MDFELTSPPTNRRAKTDSIAHFFSQDGSFQKLVEAQKLLFKAVSDSFYEPVDEGFEGVLNRTQPRPNIKQLDATLSARESQDLLLQHVGLNGEFGNGFAMVVDRVNITPIKPNANEMLLSLRRMLDAPSQLQQCTNCAGISNHKLIQATAGLTNGQETKSEALKRCGRMIEKHLQVNKAIIPEAEQRTIHERLDAYTSALDGVLSFVEANRHLTRISSKTAAITR
jgi:hypothetical protein